MSNESEQSEEDRYFSENNLSHHDDNEQIIAGGTRESFFVVRKPTKMRFAVSKIPIPETFPKTSERVHSRRQESSILAGTSLSNRKKGATHKQIDTHEDELSIKSSLSVSTPADNYSDRVESQGARSIASSKNSRFRLSKASFFEKIGFDGGKTPKTPKTPKLDSPKNPFTFDVKHKAENKDKTYSSALMFNNLDTRFLRAINDKAEFSQADSIYQNEAIDKKLRGLLKKHAIKRQETYNMATVVKKLKMNQSRSIVFRAGVRVSHKLKKLLLSAKSGLKELWKPLDPQALFTSIWNSILMVFIFYELMAVPFELAFDNEFAHVFRNIEWVESIFFFIDMCLGFCTSWYQDGVLVTDRRLIAYYYLKSWFIIDFLCCFPFQLLFEYRVIGADRSFITLLGLLRAVKVVRIGKFFKIRGAFAKMQDFVQLSGEISGIMRLVKLIFTIVFIAHWCACFWHLIGLHPGDDEAQTWIITYGLEDARTDQRYVKSLYWSIATLLTVGYGDIVATNMIEQIYSIFVMLLGSGIIGLSMNKIGEILQQINSEVNYREKKLQELRKFMDKNEIDNKLQIKAKQYVEFKLEHERAMRDSDRSILQSLSQSLRDQMLKQVNGRLMKNSELFQRSFGSNFITKLSMMLDEQLLAPDEYLFRENETENLSLYFVARGRVETFLEKYKISLVHVEKGSYVGEFSFFTGRSREVSAKTATFTSVFCLPQDKFTEILETFSTDKEMYHMLKDRINLYENYSSIGLNCGLCGHSDHLVSSGCPKTHLVVNRERVITRYLEHKQSFAKNFHRKARPRFQPLDELKRLETVGRRIQTVEGVKNQFTTSFTESEINLSGATKNKKLTFLHMDSENDSDTNEVAAEAIYKTLARIKDEETGVTKLQKNKKRSMEVDDKSLLKKSLTMKQNGEAVFIPFKIQIAEDKPQKSLEEEVIMDQMKNYEIYFPHNNLRKVIDHYEYMRKKRKTIKMNLNSEHDIMTFKMKLGKIFDKSKRKTVNMGDPSRDVSPMSPNPRRKSMFFKKNHDPTGLVRMRSKSLNKVEDSDIQTVEFAPKKLVFRSRSKEGL